MLARTIKAFFSDDSGATAIEYALIGTLIAVAAIGSFTILGNAIVNLMNDGTGSAATVIANQTAKLD